MTNDPVHWKTLWGSLLFFGIFLLLALFLGMGLPDRYPTHFDFSGEPTQWSEGRGSWILLVSIASFCFGQGILFQRFLLTDPDSTLLSIPQKERYLGLSREKKIRILRRVNRMLGVINILTLALFCGILVAVYLSAIAPDSRAGFFGTFWIWMTVAGVVLYPVAEIVGLRRMILRAAEEENAQQDRGVSR